eukprot:scaffold2051_cov139-Skeletonema_marinoi.AAC.6
MSFGSAFPMYDFFHRNRRQGTALWLHTYWAAQNTSRSEGSSKHGEQVVGNSKPRRFKYRAYYPPRDLAAYIPAYLALLFVFVPILYMGLNMLSCPAVDSIDNIWDTQSTCNSMNKDVDARCSPVMGKGVNYSVPTICDEDVRSVNLRLRQNIMSSGNKRVDDR